MNEDNSKMGRRSVLKLTGGAAAVGVAGLAATSTGVSAEAEGTLDLEDSDTSVDDGVLSYVQLAYWKRLQWSGFNKEATHFDLTTEIALDGGEPHELYSTEEREIAEPEAEDEYATDSFFGSADYTPGPGTSGEMVFGIGDEVIDDPPAGVEAQGSETRWKAIIGQDYFDEDLSGDLDNREYGLPQDPLVTDALDAPQDGGENVTEVTVSVTFKLYHENGEGVLEELTSDESELDDVDGPYMENPVTSGSFSVTVDNIQSDTDDSGSGTTNTE